MTDSKQTRIGIYPGTFDPVTNGHMDVIKRALNIVDRLVIAVADDIPKTPIFSLKERTAMLAKDVDDAGFSDRVEVVGFHGLLIDFAEEKNASVIIRGLRAVSDFEYEIQLASMNSRLQSKIQTVFLPASENTQFVASRLVKEIARLGGDTSPFVSENVSACLKNYYK